MEVKKHLLIKESDELPTYGQGRLLFVVSVANAYINTLEGVHGNWLGRPGTTCRLADLPCPLDGRRDCVDLS